MMRRIVWPTFGLLASIQSAAAHGIAGNRLFPGTLTFDDPAVADEMTLPEFSTFNRPLGIRNVTDNTFVGSISRLIVPGAVDRR